MAALERDMTMVELARRIGVSTSALYLYLQGRTQSEQIADGIRAILGIDLPPQIPKPPS
jgi:transcriptional regulator with XRE-family HTH domain